MSILETIKKKQKETFKNNFIIGYCEVSKEKDRYWSAINRYNQISQHNEVQKPFYLSWKSYGIKMGRQEASFDNDI